MTPSPQNTPAPRRMSFPKTGEVCADGAGSVTPVRMRLSRAKGFNLQEASRAINGLPAVNVGRPTAWGNPFVVGHPCGHLFEDDGDPTPMILSLTLAEVLAFYESAVTGYLTPEMHPQGHGWRREFLRRFHGMSPHDALSCYLRGNNLACWCALPAPGEPDHCHAAVLLRLANVRCDEPAPAQGGPAL